MFGDKFVNFDLDLILKGPTNAELNAEIERLEYGVSEDGEEGYIPTSKNRSISKRQRRVRYEKGF